MINSVQEWEELFEDYGYDARQRLRHESAPDHVWLGLIKRYKNEEDILCEVILNKTIPNTILEKVMDSIFWRVRSFIAIKHKITTEMRAKFAKDRNEIIRADIARHKRTSKELLIQLAEDSSWVVRKIANKKLAEWDEKE